MATAYGMDMRITDEIRYDSAPQLVAAMLADREFVIAKCEQMRSTGHTVTVTGDAGSAFTVVSVRTLPTDKFPDIAKVAIGTTPQIRQEESWGGARSDGSRDGTVRVSVVGKPITFDATATLRPTPAGGSVEAVDGTLRVGIPFIGGQLARLGEPAIRAALRREGKVGRQWLGEPDRA